MLDLATALALVLAIEGLILAIWPEAPRKLMAQLSEIPPESLRIAGVTALAIGTFLVWLIRG